jgi:hypothetical protein
MQPTLTNNKGLKHMSACEADTVQRIDSEGTVIVTGVSRRVGIGSEVVRNLVAAGWQVFSTWFAPYDESMAWGSDSSEVEQLLAITMCTAWPRILEIRVCLVPCSTRPRKRSDQFAHS